MSLSESLEKFLGTVATSMSSDEQSAAVAEIVAGVRALEGGPSDVVQPTVVAPMGVVTQNELGQQ